MVGLIVLVAVFAPQIAPSDPYKIDLMQKLRPPSSEYPMGTDEMGRDVLSRAIYGTRVTIGITFSVTLGSVLIGVLIGTVGALAGGWLDEAIMRITDIFLAVPLLVLAMAVVAALGPSMVNAAIAMTAVWWPGYARQARAEVLRIKAMPYIEAARSVGVGTGRLVVSHILPNSLDPIFARMTTTIGYVMLATATLSFIGLGTRPPEADWGTMVAVARRYLMSAPWYPLISGLPLVLTVLFFAMAGDAVQDALEVKIE
jgi:peptide/nickel transport system permease protein